MAEPEEDNAQDDETIPLSGGDPIIPMREERVILAARVAEAFGVETRQVVQAVKRNLPKFPFLTAFELTAEETEGLRSQGVISKPGRGGSRAALRACTRKGWEISVGFASERRSDRHAGEENQTDKRKSEKTRSKAIGVVAYTSG